MGTQLPPGWVEHVSRSTGKSYYHNADLNKTTWDINEIVASSSKRTSPRKSSPPKPEQPRPSPKRKSLLDPNELPLGWRQLQDPKSGKFYYHNTETNKTTWNINDVFAAGPTTTTKSRDIVAAPAPAPAPAPASTSTDSEGHLLEPGWVEILDKRSGKYYYYHKEKNKTSWKRPLRHPVQARMSTKRNSSQNRQQPPAPEVPVFKNVKDLSRELFDPAKNVPVPKKFVPEKSANVDLAKLMQIQLQTNKMFVNATATNKAAPMVENNNDAFSDDDEEEEVFDNKFELTYYSKDPLTFMKEMLLDSPPGQFNTLYTSLYHLNKVQKLSKSYIDTLHAEYYQQQCYSSKNNNEDAEIRGTVSYKKYAPLIQPLKKEVTNYQKEKYGPFNITARNNVCVFSEQRRQYLLISTYTEYIQEENCRTGSWTNQWKIQYNTNNNINFFGSSHIHCFSYEKEENIHTRSTYNFPTTEVNINGDITDTKTAAKAVLERIQENEQQVLDSINKIYEEEEMNFMLNKHVRRILPITRERLPWDSLAYRAYSKRKSK